MNAQPCDSPAPCSSVRSRLLLVTLSFMEMILISPFCSLFTEGLVGRKLRGWLICASITRNLSVSGLQFTAGHSQPAVSLGHPMPSSMIYNTNSKPFSCPSVKLTDLRVAQRSWSLWQTSNPQQGRGESPQQCLHSASTEKA